MKTKTFFTLFLLLSSVYFALAQPPQELMNSAIQGNAEAQLKLGIWYSQKNDIIQAKNWMRKAAEQNNPNAQFNYAIMLELSKSCKEAILWYEKAANNNMPDAMFNLAMLYFEGKGSARNLSAAKKWLQKAVDMGLDEKRKEMDHGEKLVEKQLNLVSTMIDENAPYADVEADSAYDMALSEELDIQKEGIDNLKSLSLNGNGKADGYLAKCYLQGIGVDRNNQKAFEYTRRGAERNDIYSTCELGVYFAKGEYVEKNNDEAIRLLEIAAQKDYSYACYLLGVIYGAKKDKEKEVKWYKKACSLRNVFAFYNLADIAYNEGSTDVAFTLYRTAEQLINRGSCIDLTKDNGARFQNIIGEYYYLGIPPVKKDIQMALMWYRKAARNGNELAKKRIQEIGKR